jgi:hypothetical protein
MRINVREAKKNHIFILLFFLVPKKTNEMCLMTIIEKNYNGNKSNKMKELSLIYFFISIRKDLPDLNVYLILSSGFLFFYLD